MIIKVRTVDLKVGDVLVNVGIIYSPPRISSIGGFFVIGILNQPFNHFHTSTSAYIKLP